MKYIKRLWDASKGKKPKLQPNTWVEITLQNGEVCTGKVGSWNWSIPPAGCEHRQIVSYQVLSPAAVKRVKS